MDWRPLGRVAGPAHERLNALLPFRRRNDAGGFGGLLERFEALRAAQPPAVFLAAKHLKGKHAQSASFSSDGRLGHTRKAAGTSGSLTNP